jgi:hypothetical protein
MGGREGVLDTYFVFHMYLPDAFLCILLQINTCMYYSQLLISTISVNEDNNVVLIIMTAVDAGIRLI